MGMFDDRIFKIEIIYNDPSKSSNVLATFDGGLNITAMGTKYADITQNECVVTIGNLMKSTRDLLCTHLTPFNYSDARKSINVYAGRESTGLSLLYSGDVLDCTPSQPPDIILTIKSKTAQFFKSDILAQSYAINTPLSQISKSAAVSMGLSSTFVATDRNISNYSYTGSAAKQIDKLASMGGVDAFIDDNNLIVKNKGVPLANAVFKLTSDSGLIGIPELTEYGIRVRCLLSPNVILGGTLNLKSTANPTLSGEYTIYKTGFQVASRDTPFYSIIEATRYPAIFFNGVLPV